MRLLGLWILLGLAIVISPGRSDQFDPAFRRIWLFVVIS